MASLTQSRDAGFAAVGRVRSPSRGQRPAQPAHHSTPSTVQEEQASSSSQPQAQTQVPQAASSGLAAEDNRTSEPLGRQSSSGNPFKTIRAARSSAGRRPSLGNPFAPPEENADGETNPFNDPAFKDFYTPAKS